MLHYVNQYNIDDRILAKAADILLRDGVVALPTDTNFSILSSIGSKAGIAKLKLLKGNNSYFTFTLFCSKIADISQYTELSNRNFKIIKHYTPGPFVFILPSLPSIEKKINMKRKEIGVRLPDSPIIAALLDKMNTPLFGITASKNMANSHWWDKIFADENLFEFGWELEDIPDLDMIIDNADGSPQSKILSTVVDLTQEEITVLREGIKEFYVL